VKRSFIESEIWRKADFAVSEQSQRQWRNGKKEKQTNKQKRERKQCSKKQTKPKETKRGKWTVREGVSINKAVPKVGSGEGEGERK